MASQETDPFDRVVAREVELRERQDRAESASPRRLAMRGTLAALVGIALLFPVTWFFARDITWLVAGHVFLIAAAFASLAIIGLLPRAAFEEKMANREVAYDYPTHVRPARRSHMGGSLSFFVLVVALLPLTYFYGRHITWLVVTHLAFVAVSLADVASSWVKSRGRSRLGGTLSFFALVAALLPVTLIYGSHITWLVIVHFVFLALALSDVVSNWVRYRERFDT